MPKFFTNFSTEMIVPALGILVSIIAAILAHKVIFHVIGKDGKSESTIRNTFFGKHLLAPTRLIAILVGLGFGMSLYDKPQALLAPLQTIIRVSWIWAVAWFIMRAVAGLDSLVLRFVGNLGDENLEAKSNYTKYQVFQRITNVVVALLALAAMFSTFEPFRRMGTTILASAGVAGVILGFAAQKTLSGVLAGVQIALAQPIRIDDVVVMEGEYGRVEEINFTYVVIRLWDQRRLVLPITYFLEKPFQNWTRTKSSVTGTVLLQLSFEAELDSIRAELRRLCEIRNDLWDGDACVLQVVEADRDTMTVRALASSKDSARNWDLRCFIRERLLQFVRDNQPEGLPYSRLATQNGSYPQLALVQTQDTQS